MGRSSVPKINGLVLLDKPKGVTSNFALKVAKRRLKQEKAGHGGTLDSLASGILPVFFGSWTRLSGYGLNSNKQYRAIIRLGVQTDTGDSNGRIIKKLAVPTFDNSMLSVLSDAMIGRMEQTPPAFSAVKVAGVPSYKMAVKARRYNLQLRELPPRWIEILKLSMRALDEQHIDIRITSSKGAYIRSIAELIAERLKTCGYLVALRRLAVGHLGIEQAVSLDALQKDGKGWVEIEQLLPDVPRLKVDHNLQSMLARGQAIPIDSAKIEGNTNADLTTCDNILCLSLEGEVVAMGAAELTTDDLLQLQPRRVFVTY